MQQSRCSAGPKSSVRHLHQFLRPARRRTSITFNSQKRPDVWISGVPSLRFPAASRAGIPVTSMAPVVKPPPSKALRDAKPKARQAVVDLKSGQTYAGKVFFCFAICSQGISEGCRKLLITLPPSWGKDIAETILEVYGSTTQPDC